MRDRVRSGQLIVKPAYYEISNGVVDFLDFDMAGFLLEFTELETEVAAS